MLASFPQNLLRRDSFRAAVLCVAIALAGPAAQAGDPSIGEAISAPCVACHGDNGANPITNNPILAGQHEKYLLQSLLDYKSGQRDNPIMKTQVAQLTKRDFENLAAYFARQESPLK